MSRLKQVIILLAGLLCFSFHASGQAVTVKSITVTGLKRTKQSIVNRELTFHVGDTLPQLELGTIMQRNKDNLLNLGIFNEAVVNVSQWDVDKGTIDVSIDVKESWYIYALPILELADRNFNVWWSTYNHALDRLNLGGRLDFLNFTGNNDKLKAKIQLGYTPKQEVEYRFPYFDRRQSLGLTLGILHSINKEISYGTVDNQEQFIQLDERKLLERWKISTGIVYRPSIFLKYQLDLTYQRYKVDNQIVSDYNPMYFRNGKTQQSTFISKAVFQYDDRDFRIYPSKGIVVGFDLEKIGWGTTKDENSLNSTTKLEWNNKISGRLQHRVSAIGHYSFTRNKPSYLYYKGLGYDQNYVRGYELYIIDALDFVIGKYQIAYTIIDTKVNWGQAIPMSQFRSMPLHVYLSLAIEAGRGYDPFTADINPLANQWLYGGGPGLDIVMYNNFLFQFNFSKNHLGEWGFFIHNKTSF